MVGATMTWTCLENQLTEARDEVVAICEELALYRQLIDLQNDECQAMERQLSVPHWKPICQTPVYCSMADANASRVDVGISAPKLRAKCSSSCKCSGLASKKINVQRQTNGRLDCDFGSSPCQDERHVFLTSGGRIAFFIRTACES